MQTTTRIFLNLKKRERSWNDDDVDLCVFRFYPDLENDENIYISRWQHIPMFIVFSPKRELKKKKQKKKKKEKLCCFPLNFSLMMIRCESLWMSLVNSRKMFRHCFIIRKCRRRLSWRDSRGRKKDENGRDFSMWDDGRRKFGNFCLRGGWYDSGGGFIRRYRFLGDFRFCLEISLISKL